MNRPRIWYALAGVVAVVIVAVGWFLLVSPKRDQADQLREDTAVVEQKNGQLQAQNARLRTQFEKLPEYKAQLLAIRVSLPEDPQLPDLVRAINAVAKAAGVTLDAVNPATPSPAAAGGVGTIPLQIDATGSYATLTLFAKGLETMPRAILVQQVSVTEEPSQSAARSASDLKMSLTATAFTSSDLPAAASAGPASGGTSTATPQ